METRIERDFPVVLGELEPIHDWLHQSAAAIGLPDAVENQLLLVAEELFVNLVTYGGAAGASRARFAVFSDEDNVCLEMLDTGGAFDPFAAQGPPSPDSLLGRGGLGLYLIRNFAIKTEYARDAGHNRARVWLARTT